MRDRVGKRKEKANRRGGKKRKDACSIGKRKQTREDGGEKETGSVGKEGKRMGFGKNHSGNRLIPAVTFRGEVAKAERRKSKGCEQESSIENRRAGALDRWRGIRSDRYTKKSGEPCEWIPTPTHKKAGLLCGIRLEEAATYSPTR